MTRQRPLVKVKGRTYDAAEWNRYANAMRERFYRAQVLAQYFAQIRDTQQRQK